MTHRETRKRGHTQGIQVTTHNNNNIAPCHRPKNNEKGKGFKSFKENTQALPHTHAHTHA